MFRPAEHTIQTAPDRTFLLRRPGIGGLMRLPVHQARFFSDSLLPGIIEQVVGGGAEMAAVLIEYLVACPDDWKAAKQPEGATRPALNLEGIDPEEFATVGEAALAFHATFRAVDDRLRPASRPAER